MQVPLKHKKGVIKIIRGNIYVCGARAKNCDINKIAEKHTNIYHAHAHWRRHQKKQVGGSPIKRTIAGAGGSYNECKSICITMLEKIF
jgi:hypothetical protein